MIRNIFLTTLVLGSLPMPMSLAKNVSFFNRTFPLETNSGSYQGSSTCIIQTTWSSIYDNSCQSNNNNKELIVVKSEAKPKKEAATRPKGPNGFGLVRGLMLDKVSLDKVTVGEKSDGSSRRLYGTLYNSSKKTISFNSVKVQIQDAKTKNVLDATWNTINESDATLEPGQRIEFDFEVPKLRGREAKDIQVKLIDWR